MASSSSSILRTLTGCTAVSAKVVMYIRLVSSVERRMRSFPMRESLGSFAGSPPASAILYRTLSKTAMVSTVQGSKHVPRVLLVPPRVELVQDGARARPLGAVLEHDVRVRRAARAILGDLHRDQVGGAADADLEHTHRRLRQVLRRRAHVAGHVRRLVQHVVPALLAHAHVHPPGVLPGLVAAQVQPPRWRLDPGGARRCTVDRGTRAWPTGCPEKTSSTTTVRNGSNGSAATKSRSSFQLGLDVPDAALPSGTRPVLNTWAASCALTYSSGKAGPHCFALASAGDGKRRSCAWMTLKRRYQSLGDR
uniref:Uncharacterized protein n=1 Tax=Arundo donax TaxID=35708 RepID=A0A0A9CUS4_ARUDO